MIKANGDAKKISQIISDQSGENVMPKQIHNLKYKYSKELVNNKTDDVAALREVRLNHLNHFDCLKFSNLKKIYFILDYSKENRQRGSKQFHYCHR